MLNKDITIELKLYQWILIKNKLHNDANTFYEL